MIHLIPFLIINFKTITFFTIVFTILLWNFKRRHLYYASWQLDGPFAMPLIGNLLLFRKGRERVFETTKEILETYKAPQRFWVGPFLIVYLTEPDDLQIVLNHPNAFPKPFIYSIAKEWLGEGLLTAPVKKWKVHRNFLQPTFNIKVLDSYMERYNKCANLLVKNLETRVGLDSFDIFYDVYMCSLDIICGTTLATKTNCLSGDSYGGAYLKASNSMFDIFQYRDVRPWLYPDCLFKMCKYYEEFMENVEFFHTFSQKVLHERRTYLNEILNKNPQYKPENLTPVDALIWSSLTQIDGPFKFTDKEIQDEIEIIIGGGADSSGHTICFVLLLLAMHPEIQSRVYEEILSIGVKTEQNLTKTNLNALVYMEQVINETMRVLPAVPMVARELSGPVVLNNGVTLPAGTTIGIGIRDTHRNKNVWGEDADLFNPDRFSIENTRHPYSFIPFSGGPRNCIGLKLAKSSIKVILSKVLLQFNVSTDRKLEHLRCSMHPLAKLEGGWHVRLTKRDQTRTIQ